MTLIVQLRLRNTHNLVGARSSCSIGAPRADSISLSLRPIKRSTPCVPISARLLSLSSAFSSSSALLFSAGKAADLRLEAGGACAGSLTPAAAGPVTSRGMLVRNSAGGAVSAQPKVSSTAAKPSHRRMRRQFMPVSASAIAPMHPAARNGAEAGPCAVQTGSEFAALDRHAARPETRAYFATKARRDRSVTEPASGIWPNCGTRADFAWQTNRLEPFLRAAANPGFGARSSSWPKIAASQQKWAGPTRSDRFNNRLSESSRALRSR